MKKRALTEALTRLGELIQDLILLLLVVPMLFLSPGSALESFILLVFTAAAANTTAGVDTRVYYAVVLADGKYIEAYLTGELNFFHQVLHALMGTGHFAGHRIGHEVNECTNT